ncbi:uroporphyrinogen-III synthase [Paenibacillus campi]|uniref:uroporphyrinogen-III synthase n=1 Tax=Paenibacillus campi TaxID=3106031 RepID=UPI002B001681|nr:uroporphyrinogen-III synthase [Paenibacillus sp. SGZ-1014]
MSKPLAGKTIVIAGSRKLDEMTTLIERQEGTAIVRSLQGMTLFKEAEMQQELHRLIETPPHWIVFTTGIGTTALFEAADRLGIGEAFRAAVRQARIAIRGYKTYNALKAEQLAPDVRDSDGTVHGLEQQLDEVDLSGADIWVQLHGEPAPELVQFLLDKGAQHVHTLLPYLNIPPEQQTLAQLRQEIADASVDAICFTTAVQVRNLFASAREFGYEALLRERLHGPIVAVSVGKVTSQALEQAGISRIIAPENERMGAMIIEMCRYYEQQSV